MQNESSEIQTKYPLSPRKIVKKSISSIFGWAVILGFIYFGVYFLGLSNPVLVPYILIMGSWILGISVIIAVLTFLYQFWYYKTYFYDLTDSFVVIKKNPITPQEISIPYGRIQDVYVDQDILDRVFGLYDVHLSSATIASGYIAHIDGVEKAISEGLKTTLLEKVKQKIVHT